MADDLLEALYRQIGCPYLSDLRKDGTHSQAALRVLLALPIGKFPLSQWEKALRYLTGRPVTLQDAEALTALLATLRREAETEK